MPVKQEVIAQIDRALKLYEERREHSQFDDLSDLSTGVHDEINSIVLATLERLAPKGSAYRKAHHLGGMIGSLRALRRDYDEGYLSALEGLIRADLFADFLEMAGHLLEQAYKDPAAVLIGGVLEEHLRALCAGRAIPITFSDRPKKADAMNSDLAAAGAYNKLDQKSVTAWLDFRNKAAHGEYDQYTAVQVATMLSGVREFAGRVTS